MHIPTYIRINIYIYIYNLAWLEPELIASLVLVHPTVRICIYNIYI